MRVENVTLVTHQSTSIPLCLKPTLLSQYRNSVSPFGTSMFQSTAL